MGQREEQGPKVRPSQDPRRKGTKVIDIPKIRKKFGNFGIAQGLDQFFQSFRGQTEENLARPNLER
jgi:hypothetical protein